MELTAHLLLLRYLNWADLFPCISVLLESPKHEEMNETLILDQHLAENVIPFGDFSVSAEGT